MNNHEDSCSCNSEQDINEKIAIKLYHEEKRKNEALRFYGGILIAFLVILLIIEKVS